MVSPLTSDSATLANLLPNLSPDIMPYQGSDAAAAVSLAITMLQQSGHQQGDLILITDDMSVTEREKLISLLQGSPWRLVTLAIGTPSGAPIPLGDGSLLKDRQGQTVIAKTAFDQLQQLSQSVQGVLTAYRADGADVAHILSLTQQPIDIAESTSRQAITERVNNGYWLVLPLLIAALCLFRRGVIFSLLLLFGVSLPNQQAWASAWLNQDQQAMRMFNNEQYAQAAEAFRDPRWQGAARYYAKDYQGAIDAYSQIANPDTATQYNLANAYAQAGELQKAQDLYEHVLKQEPNHQDARHNLDVVKAAQQQQQQQQDSSSGASGQEAQEDSSANPSNTAQEQEASSQTKGASTPDPQQDLQESTEPKANAKPQEQPNAVDDAQAGEPSAHREQSKDSQNGQPSGTEQNDEQSDKANAAQPSTSVTTSSDPNLDPMLRKLEQVESARDPSALLRAQFILQAQRKPQPTEPDQPW
ncbi:TPR domain protein in aerotolerance operon [Vibrio cholerae]|nr:TPR domain protein in aerotolerance operon [Vibrio cholerae]